MSKYTTELRYILESLAGFENSVGVDRIDEVLEGARAKLFNFAYPSFPDADRKTDFENNFMMFFYNREIAYDTYGKFALKLRSKLNTIMPYYVEMYNTTKLEFDPLLNTDYERRYTGDITYTGETSNTGSNAREDMFSDTPQDRLEDVRNGEYLSAFDRVTDEATSTGTRNLTDTHDITETYKGKTGDKTYASMIKEYRETLLNIDKMIFDELESLFLILW